MNTETTTETKPKRRPPKVKAPEPGSKPTTIMGPATVPIDLRDLTLTYERLKREGVYRLIWVYGSLAWTCAEDQAGYRRVDGSGGVIEAGKLLAQSLGVKFDGRTGR